ncbi:MAG TPA: PAS domain S-box protein [Terriglobia bacterium]|jgi:PAS domain S-box-containing protein|nr:PAS domain S-box protein [Terriglobia bacterium]
MPEPAELDTPPATGPTGPAGSRHGSLPRQLLVQVAFWIAFVLLDLASTTFRTWTGAPAWYLPAGLSLAILVWGGMRYLPVVLLGGMTSCVFNYHRGIFSWAGFPGIVAMNLAYVGGAAWLRNAWRIDLQFRRLRDVGGLALFLILGALPAALIGVLALLGDGLVTRPDFAKAVFNWWVGDSISIASFAPFLLLYVAPRASAFLGAGDSVPVLAAGSSRRRALPAILEPVAAIAGIAVAIWLVFGFKPAVHYQPLYVLFFPVIWMAVRYGVSAAAVGVLTINVGVIIAAHLARPDLAGLPRLQLVMLALAVTGLSVGAVVSERSQAEAALSESERRYRVLFESAGDAILLMRDDRFVDCNEKALELFGCTRQQLIGRTPYAFWPSQQPDGEDSEGAALSSIERALSGATLHFEWRYERADGTPFDAEVTLSRIRIDGGLHLLALVRNVTKRKRAEEELRHSQEELQSVMTSIPDYLWSGEVDRQGNWKYRYYSSVVEKITGRPPEFFLRGPEAWVSTVHPEDRARMLKSYEDLRAGQAEHDNQEYRILLPDGGVRWVLDSARMRHENGVIRIDGVVGDITQRKLAEEKARHAFEQLRALAAHTEGVREEERKRVAREIHDQLGQALTALKIDLSGLLREFRSCDQAHPGKAESILRLVDETIQSVRRISTELRPGILDDLGLVAAVEWAAEEFQARTGTECRLELPEGDVAADPAQATAIFRIFQETLTNVARHANATRVDVRLADGNGGLVLEVRDNGAGISAEKLSQGQSLGILGMRERAALLGGVLAIRGAAGEGTAVEVRIPEAPPAGPVRDS